MSDRLAPWLASLQPEAPLILGVYLGTTTIKLANVEHDEPEDAQLAIDFCKTK